MERNLGAMWKAILNVEYVAVYKLKGPARVGVVAGVGDSWRGKY